MASRSGWLRAADETGGQRAEGRQREGGAQTIVLLDILAADVNFGYRASGWRVLSSFNGQHPSTLVHLRDMWEAARSRDRFIEFGFTDGRRSIVLLADEANV